MNYQPICNPWTPRFVASCSKCNVFRAESHTAVADLDAAPGTYVCWACQDEPTRDRVRLVADRAFMALSKTQQHNVRMALFGGNETREIERRQRYYEARA